MDIQTEQHQDKSIIKLDMGTIQGPEASQIQNTVLDFIQNGSKVIVIDLSKMDYITSWGIGTLIHALTTCTNRNVNYYLTGVNEKILNILQKVKLDKIFTIKESV
jgi:anti-sigma B factor antagonist